MRSRNQYDKVGEFRVDIKVTSADDVGFKKAFSIDPWVDSGATSTQIPSSILRNLGIRPVRVDKFKLADGRVVSREIGNALFLVEGKPTYDEVIFGDDNADALLGATTLEHIGMLIDPKNQRLVRREGGIIQYSISARGSGIKSAAIAG